MSPTLFLLFSTSITNYLHGNNSNPATNPLTDNMDDNPTYNKYKDVLTYQAQISWDHLLHGKFSKLWHKYQK